MDGTHETVAALDQADTALGAVESQARLARLPRATALLSSVANLGTTMVFAFFTFAMPQYLDRYHLRPVLIGLPANERSFVDDFIQPFVGRLSDRTHARLGRRHVASALVRACAVL